MEMFPQICQSNTSTEEWQPDSDPPGEVHFFCDADGIQAGLWRPLEGVTPDPVSWVLPAREVVLVLQGEGQIEVEGRSTIELSPGDDGVAASWSADHLAHHTRLQGVLDPRLGQNADDADG